MTGTDQIENYQKRINSYNSRSKLVWIVLFYTVWYFVRGVSIFTLRVVRYYIPSSLLLVALFGLLEDEDSLIDEDELPSFPSLLLFFPLFGRDDPEKMNNI